MPHQTHFKLEDIQKFLIHHFGLNTLDTYGSQKDGIMNYLNKVRAIQYDPINIVAPTADLLLAARFSNYSKDQLKQLLYEDNLLHEGWDKEASILLSEEWPYFEPIRQKRAHQHSFELKYRNTEETLEHLDFAYNHVLEHPNTSGSSIIISREKKGSWGSKNLFNSALTHLFYRGDIGISGREGNQKLYRDIRTMIPESILKKKPLSESDFYTWYILRRLDSLGIYWTKQGAGWLSFYLYKNKELKAAMKQLVADKQVIEISVESIKEKLYLTPSNYESILQSLNIELEESVRFIAPLDNFIWDRKFIQAIYNFEYTWEIYIPEAKRKFGYYVLPIIYKNIFIGRLEPDRDKDRKERLIIKNIWFEDPQYDTAYYHDLIQAEVDRYNQIF